MSDEDFDKIQQQIIEDEETNKRGSENTPQAESGKQSVSKAERKSIAEAKIDEVASALKEFLPKAKGVEKAGVGQDEIIDLIAKAVKALVNTGIEVDEAIKRVKEKLADKFDVSSLKDEDIKGQVDKIEVTKVVPVVSNDSTEGEVKDMAKSVIAALKRSEGYSDAEKQAIAEKVGEFYQTQSQDKLEEIGQAFIDELGGLEKATEEAKKSGSPLPPTVKTFILGQGILNAKKMYTAATTQAEKDKWLDMQNDLWDALDTSMREMGRAVSYLQHFYAKSPIAAARKIIKDIDARNKLFEPDANRKAADVKALIESQQELKDAINKAVGEALTESKQSILALEKEIEKLRKEINGAKGTKKNPINLGVTKEQVRDARKRLMGKTYSNPFANPEFWKDMGILAADAIQEGAVKIVDFYNYMNRTLRGKYSEAYGEIYNRAKKDAVSKGAKESDFNTEEEVETEVEKIQKESDANKITKLTESSAKSKAQRDNNAPKAVAGRIVADAKVNLKNETTKKEQDALTKVMNTIVKKASELTKVKDKPLSQKASDMVAFAFAEDARAKKIYNEAQEEVFKQIDADPNLTDAEKTELKEFLDKYKQSNFDILLSKGQKDKVIREKLIELGYAKQVNGKVVLNLDALIARAKTVDQAVSEMVKSLSKETGISEADLQSFADSIKPRLNELVAEKKANMVNAYLRKNERYRAARLIKNRTRKTRVQKLLELYNAGGLTDKRVKDALSEELGITTFSQEDEAWLAKKFEEVDKAPSGAELEKIEEEIQAFLEDKGAGLLSKALTERVRARLLSGPLTMIKNLSGGIDTVVMAIEKLIKTNKNNLLNPKNFDTNILKVIAQSRKMALNTALDIAVNGGVDLGTAFSEATNTKEGTPRVRYIEHVKKNTLPNAYFSAFGKKFNANLYNELLNREKYIGRALAFPDTINQIVLQEMKAYSYLAI